MYIPAQTARRLDVYLFQNERARDMLIEFLFVKLYVFMYALERTGQGIKRGGKRPKKKKKGSISLLGWRKSIFVKMYCPVLYCTYNTVYVAEYRVGTCSLG